MNPAVPVMRTRFMDANSTMWPRTSDCGLSSIEVKPLQPVDAIERLR
jgi:hypothetical protein